MLSEQPINDGCAKILCEPFCLQCSNIERIRHCLVLLGLHVTCYLGCVLSNMLYILECLLIYVRDRCEYHLIDSLFVHGYLGESIDLG